jgi:hypothetical protein
VIDPPAPGEDDDEEGPVAPLLPRPLDPRRIKELRRWFEGTRDDAPTAAELAEFEAWVADSLERALARRQDTRDLLALLNAVRAERRAPRG